MEWVSLNTLKVRTRRYVVYSVLSMPLILGLYFPYNWLWLQFTPLQMEKWLFTASIMGLVANVPLSILVGKIVKKMDAVGGE